MTLRNCIFSLLAVLTLLTAIAGCSSAEANCTYCKGTGEYDCRKCEAGQADCTFCHGAGKMMGESCGHCDGDGKERCLDCQGEGHIHCNHKGIPIDQIDPKDR